MKPSLHSCALLSAVAICSGIVAQERPLAMPPPIVPDGVAAYRDLPYIAAGHERQKLDLFVPENAARPLPVIIWIHGGAWSGGDKGALLLPLRGDYAQRGYAIAGVNYRLSQHAIFPAQLEDCKAAIRWLRANAERYNLNPERFGVWGVSAGGHLAALLGTSGDVKEFDVGDHLDRSSRVQCVIDDFGPTDFTQIDPHRISTATIQHNRPDSPTSRLIGGLISDPANAAKVTRANPITYITKDAPPFLIVHGDQDAVGPHHQSELLFEALKSAGVRARLNTVKGGGHGVGIGGPELEKMRRAFFDLHLKGTENDAARWPAAMKSSTNAMTPPPVRSAAAIGDKHGEARTISIAAQASRLASIRSSQIPRARSARDGARTSSWMDARIPSTSRAICCAEAIGLKRPRSCREASSFHATCSRGVRKCLL